MRTRFSKETLRAIEQAVQACEARHGGEIRVAVEDSLPLPDVLRGLTPRQRAIEVFGALGVWNTVHNNGVLIYLLLADRDVEIVADRGAASGEATQAQWDFCCRVMEAQFREGRFHEGVLAGLEALSKVLAYHPPGPPDAGNELPDPPAVL